MSRPEPGNRVTVVVITRNRRPELVRTLQRMTALPERPPVIVVDNASADGSAQAAAAFPGVTVIAAARNLGAAGRNLAVQRTSTPYVAFCDDDTWWEPGALDRAADLLDACPRLASVTGRILVEPGGTEDPITPELRHSPVPGPPWLPGPALLSILAGASMLRAAAFAEAGGFSPRLWLGGEEELLSLDLAAAGWWMCWAEDVIVHHSASAVRDPRQRRILGIRNTLWTAWLRRAARRGAAPDRRRAQVGAEGPGQRGRGGPGGGGPAMGAARPPGDPSARRGRAPAARSAAAALGRPPVRRLSRPAASRTSPTSIRSSRGSGCAPWASPGLDPLPFHRARWRGESRGGPQSAGETGPNNVTEGVPYATARCAIPVSLLITIDAAATTAARPASPVRPASTDAGLSPAACATRAASGRSAAFPLITTGRPQSDSTRATAANRSAGQRLLPLAAPGCTTAAAAARGRVRGRDSRSAPGSAGIPHHASSRHQRSTSCSSSAHQGPATPGSAGEAYIIVTGAPTARTRSWLAGPLPCRSAATAGGGPRHGTGSSSPVASTRSTAPVSAASGARRADAASTISCPG